MATRLISRLPQLFSSCSKRLFLPGCHPFSYTRSLASTTKISKVPRASRAIAQNQNLRRTDNVTREAHRTDSQEQRILPCVSISSCEQYDLEKAVSLLHDHGYKNTSFLIPNEAIHFIFPSINRKMDADVLVLNTGTIVSFGLDEQVLENEVVPMLKSSMVTPYALESEDLDYLEIEGPGPSSMDGDLIAIKGQTLSERLLDKLAFAFGLSRSTRLAILEAALETQIAMTKTIIEDLSLGKKLKVNGTQVLRSIGRLLLLRGKLNLYSELIEIPDLYWSEPNLEKIFKDISRNLDINPRISILNRKLDYATDESRLVLLTLNEEKGVRLEWIIIYLILIEVCIEVFHFYEKYTEKQSGKKDNVHS